MRFAGSVARKSGDRLQGTGESSVASDRGLGHNQRVNRPIVIATITNIAIALATYAYYGINFGSGRIAARNTARFSAICFALALAAHFHSRYGRDYVALIKGFVAAHIVHFAAVLAYHAMIYKLEEWMFWAIASTGTSLLAATALTIRRAPRAHLVVTYVVWAAFMVAFGSNVMKRALPEAPILVLLALAMTIHAVNGLRTRKIASAASA